jgi:DNA polymerase III subunit epsilon
MLSSRSLVFLRGFVQRRLHTNLSLPPLRPVPLLDWIPLLNPKDKQYDWEKKVPTSQDIHHLYHSALPIKDTPGEVFLQKRIGLEKPLPHTLLFIASLYHPTLLSPCPAILIPFKNQYRVLSGMTIQYMSLASQKEEEVISDNHTIELNPLKQGFITLYRTPKPTVTFIADNIEHGLIVRDILLRTENTLAKKLYSHLGIENGFEITVCNTLTRLTGVPLNKNIETVILLTNSRTLLDEATEEYSKKVKYVKTIKMAPLIHNQTFILHNRYPHGHHGAKEHTLFFAASSPEILIIPPPPPRLYTARAVRHTLTKTQSVVIEKRSVPPLPCLRYPQTSPISKSISIPKAPAPPQLSPPQTKKESTKNLSLKKSVMTQQHSLYPHTYTVGHPKTLILFHSLSNDTTEETLITKAKHIAQLLEQTHHLTVYTFQSLTTLENMTILPSIEIIIFYLHHPTSYTLQEKHVLMNTLKAFLTRNFSIQLSITASWFFEINTSLHHTHRYVLADLPIIQRFTLTLTSFPEDSELSFENFQLHLLSLSINDQLKQHAPSHHHALLLFMLGNICAQLKKHTLTLQYYQQSLNTALTKNKTMLFIQNILFQSKTDGYNEQLLYLESFFMGKTVLSTQDKVFLLREIAKIHHRHCHHNQALLSYQASLQEGLSLPENKKAIEDTLTFYMIGQLYFHQKEYLQALCYYKKSLKIMERIFNNPYCADISERYQNIGDTYFHLQAYLDAAFYYEKHLDINDEIYLTQQPLKILQQMQKIAFTYRKARYLDWALYYYKSCLFFIDKHCPDETLIRNNILLDISDIYVLRKKYIHALDYHPSFTKTEGSEHSLLLQQLLTRAAALVAEKNEKQEKVFMDTEATGLNKNSNRLTEIALVKKSDGKITDTWYHSFVNPECEVTPGAHRVTGYTWKFLKKFPVFRCIAPTLLEFIEGTELIMHHAPFDIGLLNSELQRMKNRWGPIENRHKITDTLVWAITMYPGQKNSLDALCQRFGIDNSERKKHGAKIDTELLVQVHSILEKKRKEGQKEMMNLFHSPPPPMLTFPSPRRIVKKESPLLLTPPTC